MLAAPSAYAAVASALPGPVLALMRVLIALILLLPPTFLMGGTLPVLSRFVVTRREHLGRGLGLLYAVNTFGAVLGCFLAGFTLIATLGLDGSAALAVGLNLIIGATVWLIDRSLAPALSPADKTAAPLDGTEPEPAAPLDRAKGKPPARPEEPVSPEMGHAFLSLIFALSGFASLGV